jgi:tetratricopeptide (TPR) repeat protein
MFDPSPGSRPTALELARALCPILDHPDATVPMRCAAPRTDECPLTLHGATPATARGRDIALLPGGLGAALAEAHVQLSLVGHEAHAVSVADSVLALDPTHDVALALRAIALTRQWNLTSFAHRANIGERAAEAVSVALRSASHLGTSHLADALVADYSGDIAYAVRALRRAIALEPLNSFAQEVLGRLEIEGGLGGLDRLRLAFGLDTSRLSAHVHIARELYFEGSVREALELLDELDRVRPDTNETRTLRCGLALWSRDVDMAARLLATFPTESPNILGAFRRLLETLIGARPFDETFEYIGVLNAVHTTPKRRAFYCQLWAELCGAFERLDGLRFVVHAAQLPLSDLRWLDACPALDVYRSEPAFKYARTLVEDRLTQAFDAR